MDTESRAANDIMSNINETTEHEGQANIVIKPTISSPTLNQRYNMTYQYLKAMKLLLTAGYQIEQSHLNEPFGEHFTDIRSYFSTLLILTGSMLDANIYERFQDVKDNNLSINNFNIVMFNNVWQNIKKRSNILSKYESFAKISGTTLDKNKPQYKDIEILVKVRNALVHYVPQWDYEKTPSDEIEKCISQISSPIIYSQFFPPTAPFFPNRCMSSGFGQWAINASLDFIKYFEDSIPIPNKYEVLRNELQIV